MPSTEPDPAPNSVSPYLADSLRRQALERQQEAALRAVVNELYPAEHAPAWGNEYRQRLASLKWDKRRKRRQQIHSDKRRALKAGATINGTVDRTAIIRRDKSICHICGLPCEPHEIHLDHVIPLSKGGAHSPDNVKVAHAACNLAKKDTVLSETAVLSEITRYTRTRRKRRS